MDDQEEYEKQKRMRERNATLFSTAVRWIRLLEQGMTLRSYFEGRKGKNLAIYGASALGELLYLELQKQKEVRVRCFFDKKAEVMPQCCGLPVIHPKHYKDIEQIDTLIVTPVFFFEEIKKELLPARPEIAVINLLTIMEDREIEACDESNI